MSLQLRIVATTSLAQPIWRDKNISVEVRMNLLITTVFLYGCESYTFDAEMEKRVTAFEMNSMWRMLQVHCSSHTTNKYEN